MDIYVVTDGIHETFVGASARMQGAEEIAIDFVIKEAKACGYTENSPIARTAREGYIKSRRARLNIKNVELQHV